MSSSRAIELVSRMEAKAEEVFQRRFGPERLNSHEAAPGAVQERFWKQLGREVAQENETSIRLSNEFSQAGERYAPVAKWQPRTFWDATWRKRAAYFRRQRDQANVDRDFDREREYLKALPAAEYVHKLTGREVGRDRMVRCPIHEERTASCHVRETRVHCFGCGFSGDIYELAGELWDMDPNSPRFRELHERLYEALR